MNFDFIFIVILLACTGNRISGSSQFAWTRVRSSDVRFQLFTSDNPELYDDLVVDDVDSVMNSRLRLYKDVKVIIHGWRNHGNSTLNRVIRKAYLAKQDLNIIAVDWSALSKRPYPVARYIIDKLANKIARMIDFLVTLSIPLSNIHILGHSLGAHIAGLAGQRVTSGNISRITGLDPAGPLFFSNNENRLDKSDADFVDVIHTSGLGLGYFAPIGHVDFYPNRGIFVQPGCGLDIFGRCSHQRSYWLYAESILNETQFLATNCGSWKNYKLEKCEKEVLMGEYVNRRARGLYYLKTNSESPYALGNSSYYATPPAPDEDVIPDNDTVVTETLAVTEGLAPAEGDYNDAEVINEEITEVNPYLVNEKTCNCTNKKTAKVFKHVYINVLWKKVKDKIDNWMNDHDCNCILHSKPPQAVDFIS